MQLTLRSRFTLPLAAALICLGCDDTMSVNPQSIDTDGGLDAAPPDLSPPADLLPLPPPTLPQAVPHAGTILKNVQLVTISWSDYSFAPLAESFGDFIVKSNWYKTVGEEYGVGPGKHLKPVELPERTPPSITDTQLRAFIKQKVLDKTLPAPSPDNQTLYMFYFPRSTTITDDSGNNGTLCSQFAGYHRQGVINPSRYTYAVIGDCGGGDQEITITASHELIEAATDPYGPPSDGFYLDADVTDPWEAENGQEVGDLCEYEPDMVSEGGFPLQKSWSNKAAAAGGDPCIPGAPATYYNIRVSPEGVPSVAAGDKITFTLTGWTVGGTVPPWKISLDSASASDFRLTELQPILSGTTVYNNYSVTLTLTAPVGAGTGLLAGVKVSSGNDKHAWPVAFTIQ